MVQQYFAAFADKIRLLVLTKEKQSFQTGQGMWLYASRNQNIVKKARFKLTYFPTEKRATSTDATGCSSSAFSEASNLFALTDFELAINTDKQSDSDHSIRLTPPLEREGGLH